MDIGEAHHHFTLAALRLGKVGAKEYSRAISAVRGHSSIEEVPSRLLRGLSDRRALSDARSDLEKWKEEGIFTVALDDPQYPESVRQIVDPPLILFFKGNILQESFLGTRLAIVGSRKGSVEGCQSAKMFARAIAEGGGCVVSGLAYGIDAAAHRGALEGTPSPRCSTIAVLGNGLRDPYPSMHKKLAEEIVARGGIVFSQFEPDAKPLPHHFLDRNRVIAGLSHGVIVIEAAARSGSLATARFALEEGRDVMVVPGSILSGKNVGSHALIQQGAALIQSVEDIHDAVPSLASSRTKKVDVVQEDPLAAEILSILKEEGTVTLSELSSALSSTDGYHAALVELELQGKIIRGPGESFLINRGV